MWIFTERGFASIVWKPAPPKHTAPVCHIRSRWATDIRQLLRHAGVEADIEEWPCADYPFRAFLTSEELAVLLQSLSSLRYDNFKGAVARNDGARASCYGRIWALLADYARLHDG